MIGLLLRDTVNNSVPCLYCPGERAEDSRNPCDSLRIKASRLYMADSDGLNRR